jgi:flagella basal body P-ring formation protein FlgA
MTGAQIQVKNKAIHMLTAEYKKVSATKSFVFTYFLITFLGIYANPAISQNQLTSQTDDKPHNVRQELPTSHQAIQKQVLVFLQNQLLSSSSGYLAQDIRIAVRDVDKRIDIPYCDTPYRFETNASPTQQSNVSVKVSCNNTNWYLFMHASVNIVQEVVVTSDNLSPGTLLSRRNLKVIEVDKNRLRGSTFTSIDEVAGARIKRRVRAGNMIDDRMLCFICKGDRVTIAALTNGLSITVYGVAQEDGVLGDTIQVRNISSDKMVYAKIASTSQVEISI